MDYIRPNEVCIPVYNNTPYDMIIERNTLIADIEIIKDEDDIHIFSWNFRKSSASRENKL